MSDREERCMPPYEDWSRMMDHRMGEAKTARQVALSTRFHGEKRVLATTEHGTHLFDIVGVHGLPDNETVMIHLRTITTEINKPDGSRCWKGHEGCACIDA